MKTAAPLGYSGSNKKLHAMIYGTSRSPRANWSACGVRREESGDPFDPGHPDAGKKCAKAVR